MTFNARTATSLVMFALFAGACVLALGLPQKAAFMPLLVGIPGALLCLWQLVLDLRRPADAPPDKDEAAEGKSEIEVFIWLGAFAIAIIGFGFIVGGPLIVLAFVKLSRDETWVNALIAGAGTFAVVYGVFILLLELPLFQGLVLEAIL
ncbi:tripartite tricarboxylate transporter TctB family protein [Ovoidimarina sediminis]|uniref:tripartite tricarboxylate transporter TctB family protein n=1 Tax=Ovoidimarina sediminis TaxID=3079856 RepID=UPI00290D9186|nr:tripartite tricarboxylate transporter TctB family protein [Rhodophyticola sp. MJ-SS7]MDU8941761.1 tripartite tricarboxylate transporter TctB family protein [Rhodophyticola sp. MJ-SS7]